MPSSWSRSTPVTRNAVTALTAVVADPTGYGRIVRAADGTVEAIVEQKDATDGQRAVREVNAGVYAFDAATLRHGLDRLDTDNAQGELYLTDVLAHARAAGGRIGAVVVDDGWQVEGVNDRVQLAALHGELNRRTVERADARRYDGASTRPPPGSTSSVTLEPDTVLEPNVLLRGSTHVATGATVGPNCRAHRHRGRCRRDASPTRHATAP